MAVRLVFSGKCEVKSEAFDPGQPGPGQVSVKTHYSLMSTGTETIVYNRLFEEGTHWHAWVQYPFYPGYASVGEVVGVGPDVDDVTVGDRVAYRSGHASAAVMPAGKCYSIPAGLDLKVAVWFALAKITAMGARAAHYGLGDSVLIIGAGPIGQMSVRWAHAAGLQTIIVVDPVEQRLALARQGGATAVFAKPVDACKDEVTALTGGRMCRVVLDTTGNPKVFTAALSCAPRFGRVVILGDSGTPSKQYLSSDLIAKGLTIVGAHDGHEVEGWREPEIVRLFFQLTLSARFPMEGMNTHDFQGNDCVAAYSLASERRGESMGIVFDWRKIG